MDLVYLRKYCTFVAEKHTNQPLPVDHWCGKYHCMKNTLFPRLCGLVLLSICGFFSASMDAAPKLYSAYIENVQVNTADVYVSASEDAVQYKCRMNRTGLVDHDFPMTATDGKFTLTGMNQCTAHTLQVWAVDADGNVSDNSITLSYSTLGDTYSLYLAGEMNNWGGTTLQFRYTPVSGVYALTTYIAAGQYNYKLNNGSGTWTDGNNRGLKVPKSGYVTFYAKEVGYFASSVDSLFLVSASVETDVYACQWIDRTAVWKGNIEQLRTYKIKKKCSACGATGDSWWYDKDLYSDAQTNPISSTASFAKFTFDLPTLSWKWEELDDLCTTTGTDYSLSLYLSADNTALQVSATGTRSTIPTGATFTCYDYTSSDKDYTATLKTLITNGTTYIASIPLTALPMSTDSKICYSVQFTYSDGTTLNTDTLFYSLAGGCTTDTLRLCHHGQTDGDYTTVEFSGTRIVQPIVYRRQFKPGYWETLCLPFEVTKMWVYDADEQQNYDIYPQYIRGNDTISGYYWLRTFTGENVSAAGVENSWQTAATEQNYLPEKNTPYIIMFPDEDNYYEDKYIYFSAEGFQTIESTFSPSRPTENDVYTYAGNNTLQPQTITNAYLLASGSEYFDGTAEGSGTLYPFEAALFATQQTVAKMPRMRINRRQDTPTNLIPTTSTTEGEVYTLWGNRVGAFASEGDYVVLTHSLPAGLYLVRTGNTTTKVCLSK